MAWPLVGRVSVLRDLSRVLGESLPAGVAIVGDAGVGKTRLLAEFADNAASEGWAVEWVTGAVSAASVPMGALSWLVPEELPPTLDPVQFMAVMRRALLARHEGRRLLLAVDDAPRLDVASASFVAQLAVMGYCLVACTARSRESLPSPIEALVKDEFMKRVELGPLADSDVETLIRTHLVGQIDPATIARVVHLVEGNPLYLRELLADGVDSGSLEIVEGRWMFDEPFGASTGLRRLVAGRMGNLSESQRTGLEALAVAEPLELAIAQGFFEDDSLEELERREVVRIQTQGRRHVAEFVHPLFGETIGAETPVTRRRSIAAELIRTAVTVGARRREDTLRLATWHLMSGEPVDEATLLAAAQFANMASDHLLAERIARSVFDGKGGFPAGLELGEAVARQGRAEEAERLYVQLGALAHSDEQRAALVLRRADNKFFRAADPVAATRLLEEARSSMTDAACRLMLDSQLILMVAFQPDPKAAFVKAVELIEQPDVPEEAVLAVTTVLGLVALWLCDFPTVHRTTEHGLELVETAGHAVPDATARLLNNRFICQTFDGRVEEAARGLHDGYRQATTPPIEDYSSIWAANLASALAVRGDVRDAVKVGRDAVRLGDQCFAAGNHAGLAGGLAVVAGQARDEANVAFALATLETVPKMMPPVEFWTPRAQAWQHALAGEIEQATELATRASDAAFDDDMPLCTAWALYDTVLFGQPSQRAATDLEAIAAGTTAVTIRAYAEHASALADGDPQSIEELAAGFESRGELLYAVTAYLQAAGLFREQNKDHAAARAMTRARRLDTQLPPEVFMEGPPGLTQRETEVATFAAQGLTSRQIADRLYVSVRTVNNHLAAAYTNLGIHSRDELAEILGGVPMRSLSGVGERG
ncbi:MAG: LuxR C-terminal-related transcriptional regulator [Actinomycetota bacterium]|nr:LuxR C-terminal-related transcriptional regulator [Actinomycetota bacterium]